MNELKCSHVGCESIFRTDELLSSDAKYICRNHTKKAPNNVRFQKYVYDRELGRSGNNLNSESHEE